jgi:hypothetical protein
VAHHQQQGHWLPVACPLSLLQVLFAFPRVVYVASTQNVNRLFLSFFLKVIIGPFDGLLISGKL